jgi:hypothetical protein
LLSKMMGLLLRGDDSIQKCLKSQKWVPRSQDTKFLYLCVCCDKI